MKYLLVMQPIDRNRISEFYMPLGLPYINGAMRSKGFDIEAINLQYVDGDIMQALAKVIIERKVDAVICGGLTTQFDLIKEVFDTAKTVNPQIITIGGGGGFSSEPIVFSELTGVDYAVIGEGEITNCELAYALDHGEDPDGILGLVIKKDSGYIYTGERKYIKDLDTVAFPSYEGLEMDAYLDSQRVDGWYHTWAAFSDDPRIMPMCLARSCPFSCKFCYHPIGKGYRSRSLDNFFEELDLWVEQYHINAIVLIDECFSVRPERVIEFCKRIKPYNLSWSCQMRVETYSAELLKTMADSGCTSACFGVESMSQKVLDNMNKKTNVKQLQEALEISHCYGGGATANIIFGSEAEDVESLSETMAWREENKKFHIANFDMIGTYPGSGYYNDALERGIITDKKKFITEGCRFINITHMPDEWYKILTVYTYLKDLEVKNRGKIISVSETKTGIDAILQCRHCGHQNHYKNIRKKRSGKTGLRLKEMLCRKCHNYNDYVCDESDYKESWNTPKWLFDWLTGEENNKLEKNVRERKYRKVAVYGMGLAAEGIADLLIKELGKLGVEVVYGIDRRCELFQDKPIPVVGLEDEFEKVDAILVAPIYYFSEIFRTLREKTDMEIVSLEDVLA